MKKLIFLIFSIMTIASLTFGQMASSLVAPNIADAGLNPTTSETITTAAPAANVITVLSVKGKVKYKKPRKWWFKKLSEGMILDERGKLKLKNNAELQYLKGGQIGTFTSSGKHSVSGLPAGNSGGDDDFLAYLTTASGWGGPGGDGGGAPRDTAVNSGGHGEGMKVIGDSPKEGKWLIKPTNFKWTGKSTKGYTLNIYEGDDAKPVFSKHTNDNSLMVDVSKIDGIKKETSYHWQVAMDTGVEDVVARSNKTAIKFVDESASKRTIAKLEKSDAFKEAPTWEKALRKGHALQAAGLLQDAEMVYKAATKAFPKNELLKSAYSLLQADM